ncbi:MAG: M12 family metallo-peptidase [Pseudomonadota bacterium]
MNRIFQVLLLLTPLFLLPAKASATQLELICPCDVRNVGLTGVGITAGVRNLDATPSGRLRFRLTSDERVTDEFGNGNFYSAAFYELTDSLTGEGTIERAEVKTGLIVQTPDANYLVLRLEEFDGANWVRRDQVRMSNPVALQDAGGEARLILIDPGTLDQRTDEERSGALYFDGDASIEISGSSMTITLPDLVNSSATAGTGPLVMQIIQNESPSGFQYNIGYEATDQIALTNGLGPREVLAGNAHVRTFNDASDFDDRVKYLHVIVLDTELGSDCSSDDGDPCPRLYQTVSYSEGDLPTRTLAETGIELLVDTDGDGVDDYNEQLMGTEIDNASSKPDPAVIDVLFLYSASVPALYGGDPSARFDQLIQLSNQVYANSGLALSLNLVGALERTIDDNLTLDSLLNQVDKRMAPFDDLESLKTNVGADIVILLLPKHPGADLCGLGNLGGFGSRGDFILPQNAAKASAVVYLDGICDDSTTVHEIGHVMGLGHSRRQDGNDGGTFPWAVGYGIDTSFVTIMAYSSEFADAPEVLNFSSPGLTCEGVPCGIDRSDILQGADAVLALKTSKYQVAAYAESVTDTDGDGTPDATDTDDDDDGVPDVSDAFPLDPAESADSDGDGTGDNADTDDDNDGVPDDRDAYPLDSTRSGIEGVWYFNETPGPDAAGGPVVIIFLPDGTFMMGQDGDSVQDDSGQDGLEIGTYQYDGTTLTTSIVLDTNGEWGLSHSGGLPVTLSGETLTVTDGPVLARIDSESLVGGWIIAGPSGDELISVVFLADNTFMVLHGNDAGDDCQCGQAGIEFGTYTWNAQTGEFGFSLVTDTNGEWGISDAGILSVTVTNDTLFIADEETTVATRAAVDADTDGDGLVNSIDTDDDNDGVPDVDDAFPLDNSESVDTDGDGTGNNADTDDDGDGVLDVDDAFPLDPTRSSAGPASRLKNLATRGFVGTGDNVLIGGLIITGTEPKTVVIRARGPALADAGVTGALADPEVALFSGATVIDSNDNWETHAGVDLIPEDLKPTAYPNEAVIATTLAPGAYTAIVGGKDGTTGIGLVEIFEVTDTGVTRLQNIATRGFVDTGDGVLIGGLVISGTEPKKVVIRAKGPSLTEQGVPGALANPRLAIFSGASVIKTNDSWDSEDNLDKEKIPLDLRPTNSLEATVYMELAPGAYTAIVDGSDGGTGVGIVEVFEVLD